LSVPSPRRLVLDTNVWLDWLVFDDPSIAAIKAAVAANRAEIFIDAACEAELERALGYDLGRKFTLDAHAQGACIAECRRVARRIGSPAAEAERAFYETFYRIHLERLEPLPGAASLLAHCHQRGCYVAVVSNKVGDNLRAELSHLGWQRWISRAVGALPPQPRTTAS